MVILVCGSLSLPKEDEEVIHQTIYSTVKEKDKGFIAWLKDGTLMVDSDVLAQLLNPALTLSYVVPPTSPERAAQGQSNAPLHSFDQRRHVEHPTERKPGYVWENENWQQQRLSLPSATPTYTTKPNGVMGKLVLKSKLRYGKISFDSADLEFLSQEFQEIPDDIAQRLLKTYEHIKERQVKIMSVPDHNSAQLVYCGDQEIEMADNELLLLKTRVINGLVSFHEDDIEARYPADWKVPVHILEDLRTKRSNGTLFIVSDEKGNLKCTIKSARKDRFVGVKDKALGFFASKMPSTSKKKTD